MFGMLTDSIENALKVGTKLLTLEAPTTREVARLIDDGISIAAIATMFGVAEEVILDLVKK